jgi:hypothetical protein
MNSEYASIGSFGPPVSQMTPMNNPLSYCAVTQLEAGFNHTLNQFAGPNSAQCQAFMPMYCANKWDGVCEFLSHDTQRGGFANFQQRCNTPAGSAISSVGLGNATSKGQVLIRNTAAEKYLKSMSGNCRREYEPFDPTVAGSPLIGKWVSAGGACGTTANCNYTNGCFPIYGVDPATIDDDPVMNKIIANPIIALDILVNIYNNAVRSGDIEGLKNTKLYKQVFSNVDFQKLAKSL